MINKYLQIDKNAIELKKYTIFLHNITIELCTLDRIIAQILTENGNF